MDARSKAGSLVANRNFLALWLGQLISNLGDNLLHINAIGFAVSSHHGAGWAMASILILSTLPALLLGPVAGILVDRVNRKRLMIGADLLRCGLIAALPVAAHLGFWAVCGVIALIAAVACFFGPARTALIPLAVDSKHLVAANAWFSASGFIVALVGTVVGGWILALWGLTAGLWVNAAVYGLSALAISLARIRANGTTAGQALTWQTARQDLRKGVRLIMRHGAIRSLMLHYVALMGLATAIYVGMVGLSGRDAAMGMKGISTLLTAVVAGLVVGGILAHVASRRFSANRLIGTALGAIAIGTLGAAAASSVGLMMAWFVVLGIGGALYASVIEASLQRIVPDHLRGRIIATRAMISGIAVLFASALSGWLIDHAGKFAVFGTIGLGCLLGALGVWLKGGRLLSRSVRWALRQLGFAYFRLTVSGLQHIPSNGGAIVAGNHPSVLDGILLLIVSPRPVRFLVAEEFFYHPFLRRLFEAFGCIPVYRTKTHNGDALRAAVAALKRGELIGIFPEGTTTDLGRMRSIRRGIGLLALKTGMPIVPLGIWGSAEAFPQGDRVPRPNRIALAFAPPVRYVRTSADPIPQELLDPTLEDIRWEILRAMRWATAALKEQARVWQVKRLQIALSALVILPLSGFLSLTANPSLDPAHQDRTS